MEDFSLSELSEAKLSEELKVLEAELKTPLSNLRFKLLSERYSDLKYELKRREENFG